MNIDRLAIAILILAGCQHWLLADETVVWNESMKVVHFETLQHSLLDKLRSQSVTGTVVIRVGLDTSGGVSSVMAISGPKDLVSNCLANSRKWRFQPNPDRSAVIVYWFRRGGLCNRPCPSQFSFEPPNLAIITMGDPVVLY